MSTKRKLPRNGCGLYDPNPNKGPIAQNPSGISLLLTDKFIRGRGRRRCQHIGGMGSIQVAFECAPYEKNMKLNQTLPKCALERLRWVELRRPRIDRNLRVCRFCNAKIESPEHALLEHGASQPHSASDDFFTRMKKGCTGIAALGLHAVRQVLHS